MGSWRIGRPPGALRAEAIQPPLREIAMKKTMLQMTLLAAVFAPFLRTAAALVVLPHPWETFRDAHGEDWIWLILLGALMLGLYYFFAVYLLHEEDIAEEFMRLDTDHDGFISREDAKNWPELSRVI